MWFQLGTFILKYRLSLLILLFAITGVMGYFATKVQMSYEFSKAIPTNNPKYIDNQQFVKQFGQSGNTLVLGIQSNRFYTPAFFNAVEDLHRDIKGIPGVEGILSIPEAVTLVKNDTTVKLETKRIFTTPYNRPSALDSDKAVLKIFLFIMACFTTAPHTVT